MKFLLGYNMKLSGGINFWWGMSKFMVSRGVLPNPLVGKALISDHLPQFLFVFNELSNLSCQKTNIYERLV